MADKHGAKTPSHIHYIQVCGCGAKIDECICKVEDKLVDVLAEACPLCHADKMMRRCDDVVRRARGESNGAKLPR
jgi:hypothetical protein